LIFVNFVNLEKLSKLSYTLLNSYLFKFEGEKMIKKIVLLLTLPLILNSCEIIAGYAVLHTANEGIREMNKTNQSKKSDGEYAIRNKKYKQGVLMALKNTSSREISGKGKIWKIEISIPENTEIKENAKMYKFNYHLVDLKTGYGLPIYISINNCNYGETGKELDFSYDIQNLDEESRKEARNLIEKIKEANSDIKCEISSKEN